MFNLIQLIVALLLSLGICSFLNSKGKGKGKKKMRGGAPSNTVKVAMSVFFLVAVGALGYGIQAGLATTMRDDLAAFVAGILVLVALVMLLPIFGLFAQEE